MDTPMPEIVHIRVETLPNFTLVVETPDVCMGVAETPPDHNIVVEAPPLA